MERKRTRWISAGCDGQQGKNKIYIENWVEKKKENRILESFIYGLIYVEPSCIDSTRHYAVGPCGIVHGQIKHHLTKYKIQYSNNNVPAPPPICLSFITVIDAYPPCQLHCRFLFRLRCNNRFTCHDLMFTSQTQSKMYLTFHGSG